MSDTELETTNRFTNTTPKILYEQIHKVYEEFKIQYQDYDPTKEKIYRQLYHKLGRIYQPNFSMQKGDAITQKLHQEIAQFRLELELSPYLFPLEPQHI